MVAVGPSCTLNRSVTQHSTCCPCWPYDRSADRRARGFHPLTEALLIEEQTEKGPIHEGVEYTDEIEFGT
jgi:hypothetical protein